jgi:putative endonuclease
VSDSSEWLVYVLLAKDRRRTYVGVTVDLDRRLRQHDGDEPGGAKSTRAGRPWKVAKTYGPYANRSLAQSMEHRVKQASGQARLHVTEAEPALSTDGQD